VKTIRVASDEHWHDLRRQHVGGSEVAALFGEHPQVSKFELWNRKKGVIPEPDLSDNDRVLWGTILEPAVAQGVAAKTGWQVRKVRRYHSLLPDIGLGGSLDYEIVSHERGPGILEIKTADWLVTRNWEEGEPPLNYELQVQAYLRLTGRAWGCMAVLVGGNDLRLFEYERRPKTIQIIESEVASFWASIAADKPPIPDYTRDVDTIRRVYSTVEDGKTVDLGGSNRAPELIANYRQAMADEKDAEKRKDAAKAELLTIIGDAERAICGNATVSTKMVPEAVISYTRKAYRGFHVNIKKDATT
jgi:putative phage-type endonuclease